MAGHGYGHSEQEVGRHRARCGPVRPRKVNDSISGSADRHVEKHHPEVNRSRRGVIGLQYLGGRRPGRGAAFKITNRNPTPAMNKVCNSITKLATTVVPAS